MSGDEFDLMRTGLSRVLLSITMTPSPTRINRFIIQRLHVVRAISLTIV
jgi:hypothetical protein